MPLIDLVALWKSYGNILWEPGQHKDTCKAYVGELQEIAVRNRITAIDNTMLDAMISELRGKGNRNSTINRKMACLSKLLRKHQRNGGMDRLPDFAKLPEKNGRIRFLSRDEEGFLFACLDGQDPDYGALARFLIATGARIGEALSLTWADCNDGRATFWETKANTPRTVPLTNGAIKVLEGQRGKHPAGPFAMVRYANFRMPGCAPSGNAASTRICRSCRTCCDTHAPRASRKTASTSSASRNFSATARWR